MLARSGHQGKLLTKTIFVSVELLILDQVCSYLNESSPHLEFEYVMIILIQGSTNISVVGNGGANKHVHCAIILLSVHFPMLLQIVLFKDANFCHMKK